MNILLHICCGVCSASVVERLKSEGHTVTGYFYNPNIWPPEEYLKRLDIARAVSREMDFTLHEGVYEHDIWLGRVKGMEGGPEGGKRCGECFRMRLNRTFEIFRKGGYDVFTTTLTVSPVKDKDVVNGIGEEIAGDKFLRADFKKKGGYQRSLAIAKEMGLYRQNYCGCEFSKHD
ncbi:MAG: epoxyqueuosine reductase QueH [Candidatus Omnitrophica bacterium]|nr:epoxyqueuosine reductase QueH [Candidatus Omnitrophota bacterium]